LTNGDRDLAPPGTPPPVPDHRPRLRAAGFTIETYEAIPEAKAKRRAIYERYVASQEALYGEMGAEAAPSMRFEARRALGRIDGSDDLRHSRRIFVVARRSGGKPRHDLRYTRVHVSRPYPVDINSNNTNGCVELN
jgi:hypothetical protein